ncbi:MAG: hypothetical protein V2A69_05560 [Pseudomonadota bacterium]
MILLDFYFRDCHVVPQCGIPRNDSNIVLLFSLFRQGGRGKAEAISILDNTEV